MPGLQAIPGSGDTYTQQSSITKESCICLALGPKVLGTIAIESCSSLRREGLMIDHRSLLVRYIRHVTECEGTNYICRIGDRKNRVQFSEEEVAELRALEDEGASLSGGKPNR